jgi:hypothetical protein
VATLNILPSEVLPSTVWPLGAHFFNKEIWRDTTQRKWAKATYNAGHLAQTIRWATNAATRLTPVIIRLISRRKRGQQWEAQHVGAQPVAHATTAPLTKCKPQVGPSPFFLHDDHRQSIRRARLLMGRSYTQSVRHRFPKSTVSPPSPACTFQQCTPADANTATPDDSIEHILLHCHRHQAARDALRAALLPLFPPAPLQAPSPPPPLTLSTILCATLPPPPFQASSLTSLLTCTNAYLDRVGLERTADSSLFPFENG